MWTYADIQSRLLVPTSGKDTLEGYAGADVIDGLGGDDSINGKAGDDTLRGGVGNDDLQGGLGNDTLLGGEGNDRLLGYGVWLDDTSAATNDAGNDVLYGGAGNDRMFGGQGNDTYLFGRGDGFDEVGELPNASGTSLDVLRLGAGVLPEHVTLHRFQDGLGSDDLMVVIDGSNTQIWLSSYFSTGDSRIESIEFDGGAGPVWTAADIAGRVETGTQNSITGTASNDTFVVDHELDTITESANAGIDTVLASRTYTLPGNVENLTLTGFLNINGTGNALDNILRGNSGDNVLTGNGGNDVAYGGLGNDTYKGVTPVELAGEGVDIYLGLGVWVLPDNIETWDLNDGSGYRPNYYYSVRGNALDNVLISDGFGFGAAIQPNGTISGDILDGGGGADTVIIRGSDKPIVYVDNPGDRIVGGAYEVRSTVDYALSEPSRYAEGGYITTSVANRLVLLGNNAISGTGNVLDNVLAGNGAGNTLIGGAGNDILAGSALATPASVPLGSLAIYARGTPVLGSYPTMRIYVDGSLIQEFTVDATNYTAYTVDPARLGMAAGRVDVVFGNDAYRPDLGQDRNLFVQQIVANGRSIKASDNGVLYDIGSGAAAFDGLNLRPGMEVIYSNGALRFGLGDNDTLDGGTGADRMAGGGGNDTYVVDDPGDILIEMPNEGLDTVRSIINHTLGDNLENLILLGSAAIDGSGNALGNLLMGNAGNNILTHKSEI